LILEAKAITLHGEGHFGLDQMADKETQFDALVIEKVFPNPGVLLSKVSPSLSGLLKDCIFVLDANTLLAPFLVGKDSLKDVEKVLGKLTKENRLVLSGQAVREYIRHRATKLGDLYGHIHNLLSNLPKSPARTLNIPMLEDDAHYKAAEISAIKVRDAIADYKMKLTAILTDVREWHGDDPVSALYRRLFKDTEIIEHNMALPDLQNDLDRRVIHSIPPGFKDKSKPDGGIGDVIIWHTLLRIGREKKSNVIFVSNDSKSDWMVKSGEDALFPRAELVDEFHREL
jgi:hypothetical protein